MRDAQLFVKIPNQESQRYTMSLKNNMNQPKLGPKKSRRDDAFEMSTGDYDLYLQEPAPGPRAEEREGMLGPLAPTLNEANHPVEFEEEGVLFVCCICTPIGPGERPVVRLYDNDNKALFLREIYMNRSELDRKIFTCQVPVKPRSILRMRVAVKLTDGHPYEENVVHSQGFLNFRDSSVFRTYQCPTMDSGAVFSAVVRDCFVTKYATRMANTICLDVGALRGWVSLLSWLISHFESTYPQLALAEAFSQVVPFAPDELKVDRTTTLPLTDLLQALPGGKLTTSVAALLKLIWLADLTTAKTQVRLTVDNATFRVLDHLDVVEVYQAIMSVASQDFQRAATLFVGRVAEASSVHSIQWAMLRLALSPSVQAEAIVRRNPMAAVPYLPLFLQTGVSVQTTITVFSLFPTFRVLRALNTAGEFVLPAAVVTNICASAAYRMPLGDPEQALTEYQALLHFVLTNDELLFTSFAGNRHLKVDSPALAVLSVQDKAEMAVMSLIRRLSTNTVPSVYAARVAPLVIQRCRELREFLQPNTLHADQHFVRDVYAIIRKLLSQYQQVSGVLQAVRDLSTALPSSNCTGLVHRFVAFLREDSCADLVQLEAEAFRDLCVRPENDPVSMRKHFWDVMQKVLKESDSEAWCRATAVVADLWNESYERATAGQIEIFSVAERNELSMLGFGPEDVDPVLSYLLLDSVRTLYDLINAEVREFPIVLQTRHEAYCKLFESRVRYTENRVSEVRTILRTERLLPRTLQVLLKHASLYQNLRFSEPTFEQTTVDATAAKLHRIRKELDHLLLVFRDHMPQHPRFQHCSGVFVTQVEQIAVALENTFLCDWALPNFGGGEAARLLMQQLHDAQGSLLYLWIWRQQCEAERNMDVSEDPNVAIEQWVSSVRVSMDKWRVSVAQLETGHFSRADLQSILSPVLEDIPEMPAIPTNPIEAGQAVDRYSDAIQKHLESNVAAEVAVVGKVLEVPTHTVYEIIAEFAAAVAFQPLAQALTTLVTAVHCQYDASQDPLCRFLSAITGTETSVSSVIGVYRDVKRTYPQIKTILNGFPQLLAKLLDDGLHTLLNSYPEVSTLDQVVRRKVGEAAGQRDQMLLMALFETRKALETGRVPTGYPALVNLRFSTVSNLLTYLANVSWSVSCLRPLVGGVGLLSDLLQGGASVASTVVLVHALMGTGEFSVAVRDFDVQLTATALLDKDGVVALRTFTSAELGDIPFKLCMVGVQKSTDEVQIQRHFLQVLEQLKVLSRALLTLAIAGHPNFQECSLVVQGSVTIDELKALIREQTEKHTKWQQFLSSYADVHLPLLTCFTRHQLVESLRFVGRPEHSLATAHLLRTVCPSLNVTDALELIAATPQLAAQDGVLSSREVFAQVHQVLLAAIQHIVPPVGMNTPLMRARVNTFMVTVPDKLKVPSGINVLRLAACDSFRHNEVVSALYIGLKKRLPAAVELFYCSPQTTEQAATDFVRRWAAAEFFGPTLPAADSDFLFCMMNAEQLPPHTQGVIASQLHALRKTVRVALLVVVSIDKDADSLLSSGLRASWVSCIGQDLSKFVNSCLPLCTVYLQKDKRQTQVYRAEAPASGKSAAILNDHALCRAAGAPHRRYAVISVTGDADDAVDVLRAVERDRASSQENEVPHNDDGIVLHLNISSHFDTQKLNRFLMHYLVTGVLTDSKGNYVVRNAADIIAIEWPSEGILADSAWKQCSLLSCFKSRPIERSFSLLSYTFAACLPHNPDCVLYRVTAQEDAKLRHGVQMALAFFKVNGTFSFDKMPYCEEIELTEIPESTDLFAAFSEQMTADKEVPVLQPAGQVYRFVRFLAHQMRGLTQLAFYQWASAERDDEEEGVPAHEHCRNYRRLAFHFASSSLHLARLLAASAVDPLVADTDDDARLNSLRFSFDHWRDMPFLIFSEDGDYQTISVSDSDILSSITAGDKFQAFRAFVNSHKSAARVQSLVDLVTSGLTEDGYDPATNANEHHALKVLLPMISEVPNYGRLIFRALQDPILLAAPNTSIASMMHREDTDPPNREYHESAVEELRMHMGAEGLSNHHTFAHFQEVARQWFLRMTGSYCGQKAPFVLTKDNLIRLLTIKMRLTCRVPVVFVGETGCGKTHLVNFLSLISGLRMETYNIYGGITPTDVLKEMQGILHRAQGREVVVLLDEINSNSNVWMIKELVCDRCILGRRIPQNVRFICIMNPRRQRNSYGVVEAHGLDYSPYRKATHSGTSETASPLLVYEVYRSPESLMNLVWDFGMPSESFKQPQEALRICHNRTYYPAEFSRYISDELMFTENLVHWMISAHLKKFNCGKCIDDEHGEEQDTGLSADFALCNGDADGTARHYPYLRALLSALIDASQRYMRTEQGLCDKSAASLRDISRVISQIPFLMDLQVQHAEFYPPDPSERVDMYFHFLAVAVQASLVLNYALRIVDEKQRADYLDRMHDVWRQVRANRTVSASFLPAPQESAHIYRAFDGLALKLCSSLLRPKGIAMNQALKENVLSLFCAVMGDDGTGIFQFIVGRPGSTKSSSLDILCASSDPSSQDPRSAFFRKGWFSISKFLLQCTPDTNAQDILKLAQTAANAQRLKPTWRCIIVLEEVGVTLGSKHNPLMVLHGLIDRGVPMEDGSFVKLPIIGISNWQLDGSKMSRMRTTYRGNPSVHDLVKTAECIMEIATTKACAVSTDALRRFATVFRNLVLSDSEKEVAWFYGMRDFYAFVQFLQIHHSYPLTRELKIPDRRGSSGGAQRAELDPHLVQWAVKISFGGHPDQALERRMCSDILSCFITRNQLQSVKWIRAAAQRDQHSHADSDSLCESPHAVEYLCDMCARVSHYVDKKLFATSVMDASEQVALFHAHLQEHQSINDRCTQLEAANSFPVISMLSYCLNVYQSHLASKYRVRHVLLFTRANAGLRLLFSLGIVRSKESHIIFGRVNASETEKLDDLLLVRRCMQNGLVLILVGAHHISESLYDALNQHYVTEGKGENRVELTRLTMNGFTASFPVHASFRCISIEQEETCRSLLPPYINRFTKAHLNYSSALNVSQLSIARSVRAKSSVDIAGSSIDLLQLLVPGFSADTLDSLVFLVQTSTKHGLTLPATVKLCCDLLSFIVVPRRLQQLACGLYEQLSGDAINDKVSYWSELVSCRSHSLLEDFQELQSIRAKLNSSLAPHLFLFTEQLQVSQADVERAIEFLFPACQSLAGASGFVNLNKATDMQITQLLAQLAEAEEGSFCCAYFDTTRTIGSTVSLLIDRFMHMVHCADLSPTKHVVLVGVLMNSSVPGRIHDDLQLHFDPLWNFMFIDELCVAEDTIVGLSALLTPGEESSLVNVLHPTVLASFIVDRALSIAQHEETRDGLACASLAALLVAVFSNEEDAVTIAVCDVILHNMQYIDEVKSGSWRKAALRKVKHAHSLREHFTLFLRAFSERAILKFGAELFAFRNFVTHCAPESTTRVLFVQLLRSPLMVSERSLSACVNVDLPLPVTNSSVTGAAYSLQMFVDRTQPVQFPFSFLIANLLHPVATASGGEACQTKCSEILSGCVLGPELVSYYTADFLTHVLQITAPDSQRSFLYLFARRIEHPSAPPEDWEIVHLGRQPQAILATESDRLESMHMLLLGNVQWVEAVVRLVTSPALNHALLLARPELSLLRCLLKAAAAPSGVVALDVLADIALIAGGDCYFLQLHQAVAIATAQESEEVQRAAAGLVQRVTVEVAEVDTEQHETLLLEEAFLRGDPVALQWAKFLLPVLFRANEDHPGRVLSVLLLCLRGHFQVLPRSAVGSILKKALDLWLKTQVSQIVVQIEECIDMYGGKDGLFAILVSRCTFDICEAPGTVLAVQKKFESLPDSHSTLRAVCMSGCLTAALYVLCEGLKADLAGGKVDHSAADLRAVGQLTVVGHMTQSVLTEYPDFVDGAALFSLRTLSSGGVETETAKRALQLCRHLPTAVATHRYCAEIVREAEDSPCPMHMLPGYALSLDVVQLALLIGGENLALSADLLTRFDALQTSGRLAALLDVGFCRGSGTKLTNAEQLHMLAAVLLPRLDAPDLVRFGNCLLRLDQELPTPLRDMKVEHRRLFSIVAVLILTFEAPVFQFYRGIAFRANANQPDIAAPDNASLSSHMHRFLLSSANLMDQLMNAAAPPTEDVVHTHTDHVLQNILTIRCPGCRAAFVDFDGCFSVTCRCGCCFCGWCFARFPDAHAHVLTCQYSLQPGNHHGTQEQFNDSCRKRQLRDAKQYFNSVVPANARAAVLDATLTSFSELAIPVAELVASVGYTVQYCVHAMKAAVTGVKAGSFAASVTEDPAIVWMDALLLLQLAATRTECPDIAAAHNIVLGTVQHCPTANILVDLLLTQCQLAISAASELPTMLSWNEAHENSIMRMSHDQLNCDMPHHFARRTRATPQMFWQRVNSDERFAMLSYLALRAESLSIESAMETMTVLNYVGDVLRICASLQLSRQKATAITLAVLAADYSQLGGDRMEHFCQALQKLYQRVQRWECRDKEKLDAQFGHLVFDGSLPLVYLLPQSRDEGLLINVLYCGTADPMRDDNWKGLGVAQNPAVQELVRSYLAPVRSAQHRPFALTQDDMLVFDKHKQVYQHLLSLYVDPQPVVEFTNDLINLQWQVIHGAGIWGKPMLATTLPEFAYVDEQKSSVFGKLAAVVDRYGGVLPVRLEILHRLQQITTQHHSSGDHLIAYLTILAAELVNRPTYQVPFYLSALAELVPVTMTEQQLAGRALLSERGLAEILRPQHILSLVEPLWDGALCPKCCVPLDEAAAIAVEAAFVHIVANPETVIFAPQLRSAFRMLGLQKLCIEQVGGYYEQGFVDMLELMVVGPDLPIDRLLRSSIVGEVPTRHFDAVFKIADRVLSTALVGTAGEPPEHAPGEALFEVYIEELRTLFSLAPEALPRQPPIPPPLSLWAAHVQPPVPPPAAQRVIGVGAGIQARVHRWEGRGLLVDLDI